MRIAYGLFVGVFYLLCNSACQAQELLPSEGLNGNQWTLNHLFRVPEWQSTVSVGEELEISGETYNSVITQLSIAGVQASTRTIGYTRTQGDQIYVAQLGNNGEIWKEYLQYDFSLMAGDTMMGGAPGFGGEIEYLIVDRDTISCNGVERTRWTVNINLDLTVEQPLIYRTIWIESIGDLYHPFIALDCYRIACESEYHEQSYRLASGDTITLSDLRACEVVTRTNTFDRSVDVSVFPNPLNIGANGVLSIESFGEKIENVRLFNIWGQIVYEKGDFTQGGLGLHQIDLTDLSLPSAVYFLVLTNAEGKAVTKKLKIDR